MLVMYFLCFSGNQIIQLYYMFKPASVKVCIGKPPFLLSNRCRRTEVSVSTLGVHFGPQARCVPVTRDLSCADLNVGLEPYGRRLSTFQPYCHTI